MRAWRQVLVCQFAVLLVAGAPVFAETEQSPKMPTWPDEIANGLLPYHQLKGSSRRADRR